MPVGAGLAVAGAGTAYSANKSSKAAKNANRTAQQQVDVSQALLDQTDPLRQALIDRSLDLFSNPGGILESPAYLALKDSASRDYGTAKDNIIASLPAGGGIADALADLEANRAGVLTQGAGQLYDNEVSRALGLATGTVPTALNGLGMAGNAQASIAGSLSRETSDKSSGFGQAAGSYLGSK